jgi:hypothetical protein
MKLVVRTVLFSCLFFALPAKAAQGWYTNLTVVAVNLDGANNITVFTSGGSGPGVLTECGSKFAFNSSILGSNFQPTMSLMLAAFLSGKKVNIANAAAGCGGASGAFPAVNSQIQ